MEEQDVIDLIQNRLRLNVETKSEYTGSMGDPLYSDTKIVQLLLDDEVISEVYIYKD